MSVLRFVLLACDHPGCSQESSAADPYLTTVRRSARREGWRSVDGRDYCPKHAEDAADGT